MGSSGCSVHLLPTPSSDKTPYSIRRYVCTLLIPTFLSFFNKFMIDKSRIDQLFNLLLIILGYTTDRSEEIIIAFSSVSEFEVRLPIGNDNTSILNLFVQISDILDCISEYNMTSVIVTSDLLGINDLINTFENSPDSLTTNPFIQLLASGNQNTVGQVLTSISQQFNKINSESLQNAVSSKYQSSFYFSNLFF